MTWTTAEVEAALLRAGLDPTAFDLEATAEAATAQTAFSKSLDSLVTGQPANDPVSGFDARWR